VLLSLYVDDTIITGDPVAMASLTRRLQSEFEMKDLGFLRYFLGIEVADFSHAIFSLSESTLLIFLSMPP